MTVCIFEDGEVRHLLPLVRTRPVFDLRAGRRTLLERLRDTLDVPTPALRVRPDLAAVARREHPGLPVNERPEDELLLVNGRLAPEDEAAAERLRAAASELDEGLVLQGETLLAARLSADRALPNGRLLSPGDWSGLPVRRVEGFRTVDRLWDLIDLLPELLEEDLDVHLTEHGPRVDEAHVTGSGGAVVAPGRIHCHPSVTVKPGVILNAENGPIVIDREAILMERAVLRGPLYVGPKSQVKIGARLEGSALGIYCKAGGEIEHSVMHAYANKAHEGFLGHSYISPWCNLAADTNTSNLKNDYGEISAYDVAEGDFVRTGHQFLGLFMADHSRCGINTMFNTGTVVGVFCNIFGVDYPPRFVPSFSWGDSTDERDFAPYRIDKALEVAERVMARRDVTMSEEDARLLRRIYEETHERPSVSR